MTMEDFISGFFLILIACVIGLVVWHAVNPKNTISRGLEAFWNSPAIKSFRMLIWGAFWLLFLGFLAIATIRWYFTESGWYPREREVEVFFKAHQWIDGEIQTCYSNTHTTEKTPDAELREIVCSFEGNESHVLRVKFWGPVRADKNKVWRCERFPTTMICRLQ